VTPGDDKVVVTTSALDDPPLSERDVVPSAPAEVPAGEPERPRPAHWSRWVLPTGAALPDEDWERHHRLVVRVLVALSFLVPLYGGLREDLSHVAGHALPLVVLTLAARADFLGRAWRSAVAAIGLMTAAALVVHSSQGATEAHFMFFALLPVAAVYAARAPFLLAVGYVAVHHFVLGSMAPWSVFEEHEWPFGMAALHAGFVLAESVACLVAWRLFEDRRELVERTVLDRTTQLREQRDALALLAAVVDSTDDAVVRTTPEGHIVAWNRGAERLYGYTAGEVAGRHVGLLYASDRKDELGDDLGALADISSVQVERLLERKDGSTFAALATISNIYDTTGQVVGVVGISKDISERKRREAEARASAIKLRAQAQELTHLATHDPLTGLANRSLMHQRLEQALARPGGRAALLLLDLDDFKSVNDAFGHVVGDAVLVEVARRLESCTRPADLVARLGGDEFVVVLDGADDEAATAVAARVLEVLEQPVEHDGERFPVGASIGITLTAPAEGRGATELLRDADIAMYDAKAAGKGRRRMFQTAMYDEVVAHAELVRDLRDAVGNGELTVRYQPQVDLKSGQVTGVEALVRWQHPERGLLTPDLFIDAAESTGIICDIDDWVLTEACSQLRAWDDSGLAPLRLAVNVSPQRLVTGDLAESVTAALAAVGLPPGRLEIEITETVGVEHEAQAVTAIRQVRALGVHVAIDDFGMGHSGLDRLRAYPLDRLKIDRSFIAPLAESTAKGSIADAMIALGNSLGLEVIAEGVEDEEHIRALLQLGCTLAQGYLFSRPATPGDLERLVRAGSPLPSDRQEAAQATPAGPLG
jgi:diguanylate cyclase (GGDEF)-like protein/PAS domain S-box-containing protein